MITGPNAATSKLGADASASISGEETDWSSIVQTLSATVGGKVVVVTVVLVVVV